MVLIRNGKIHLELVFVKNICEISNPTGEAACRDREFRCDDGLCINVDWKCDGENDCDDMSDERDCQMPECSEEEFQCRAGRCIKSQWRCDGEFDCADNSDEDGCAADECAAGQFRCNDGSCISQLHVCNGEYECPDGSDELENRTCKTGSPCREDGFPCQHLCLSTSTGPRCACKHGYHLALDRRSCMGEWPLNPLHLQRCR
ncbi:low-density lipoprotein receptor-related protein 4 [Caerostris darwini]|uniref:Low-density lipoprotein receptor-related protein 4 n=1 Tax=Caerostris darwini TaxID=1538125 RepID=A0AAV4SLU4_9ARAC|nr:low-density lipoprotein receptor-related protein 4 [Caerostris darwini]